MKYIIIKTAFVACLFPILALGEILVSNGRNNGTVVVTNVGELMDAIKSSKINDVIIVSTNGSPYNLSEQQCMNEDGHLYIDKKITIKGQTGNPDDVLLVGSTNRILYIRSTGVRIDGLTFIGGNCSTNNKPEVTSSVKTWGGALYLGLATNECKVLNCTFTNNIAFRGGALASYKTNDLTTVISNCHFYCNSSEDSGGAIYNGGKVFRCTVSRNSAIKYGGGISNGIVEDSKIRDNYASRGCELNECSASLISYIITSLDNRSKFNNVIFDRGKITVTNTYLFSGYFDVRNSVISDSNNVTLSVNTENRTLERFFEFYDSIGNTNYTSSIVSLWNSRFINCTIVNNRPSIITKYNPDKTIYLDIQNCLFYSNSVAQKAGSKVNKYLADNNCYKSVDMSNVQRLISLGWDGITIPDAIMCYPERISLDPNDYGQSGDNWMNNTYIRKWVTFKDGMGWVNITYLQYFFARGWKGDTRQSSFENSYPIAVSINNGTLVYMDSTYTTNCTWYGYYKSLGWDGISDYTGGETQNIDISDENIPLISKIFGNILNVNADILSLYQHTNNYVYSYGSFNPMFAQSYLPSNRYAIDTSSPACHTNFWEYGIGDIWTYPREIWIENSKDLIGVPRLHGGGLDIGAYQAEDIYPK